MVTHEDFNLRHEIFVLDSHLEAPLDESNKDSITNNLINCLLEKLGMDPLAPLAIYPATDLRAPGWSFIQPITTSHISGHYFEKPGRAPNIRIDIYSCEAVDWQLVVSACHEHLSLSDWRATFLEREIEQGKMRRIVDICGEREHILSESVTASETLAKTINNVKDEQFKKVVDQKSLV